MMKMFRILALSFLFCATSLKATDDDMPIIAYKGVPYWQTTEENFRIFRECGFTISLDSYPSIESMVKACRCANKYGIKILGRCPETTSKPTLMANTLKNENGFFGYMMQDEPSVPEIIERQKEIERLITVDSSHVFYINLLSYQRQDWFEKSTQAKTFTEYLKALSATSCQYLSFDYYPITTAGIRPTWYYNLEMVRQESLASGKPFWGFVLSVPHNVPFTPGTYYPTPTLASLRLQVYSNLAYGAQGIQYFTYWTPKPINFEYHDGPISFEGKKTSTYEVVQQMNRELKVVSKLFYGARVLSVHHLGVVPEGTTRQQKMPVNIRSLKIVGKQGAIISQIEKNGHRYLAIVNKSHEESLTVRLRYRNSKPRQLTKQLKAVAVKSTYTVAPGDLLLFRLR